MSHVQVDINGDRGSVVVDGRKIHGVNGVRFEGSVRKRAMVTLTIASTALHYEGEAIVAYELSPSLRDLLVELGWTAPAGDTA